MGKRLYPNRMNKDILGDFKKACVLNNSYQSEKMDELIESFFNMEQKDIKEFSEKIKKDKLDGQNKNEDSNAKVYRKGEYANRKAFSFSLQEENINKFKEFCDQESLLVYEFLEALIEQWLKEVGVRNADSN